MRTLKTTAIAFAGRWSAKLGRRARIGVTSTAALALALTATPGPAPANAESWPANVRVLYDIAFNGINIGTFEFQSQAEQQSYTLSGNARLSLLLGAFTWDSETRSFGLLINEAPKPASFSFDYKSTLTAGSTKMGFADGVVTNVRTLPPEPPKAGTIPVREQHLQGVFDPLTAVMVLSRGPAGNPCDRRVPIFDGKERFDLVFSYKGQMPVSDMQGVGKTTATVCRVRYLPIAGHKVDGGTKFMAANENIEVALMPMPSAGVFVPYQITIPTMAGSATLTSTRVEIGAAGKPQIAYTR